MTTLLLAACLLAAPNVELAPLDGDAVRGKLHSLSMQEVTLQVADDERTFPAKAIEELRFSATAVNDYSSLRVLLADGSELRPNQVTVVAGKLKCEFAAGTLEIPVRQVRSVLFKRQSADLARQWKDIEKAARTSDLVVVRRRSPKATSEDAKPAAPGAESLDFVDGTITGMSADAVQFDLGEDQSSLKREKLDGVIFGRRGTIEIPAATVRLTDSSGSRWNLASFVSKENGLELTLAGGLAWSLPQREVAALDFSPGNVLYLDSDAADLRETSFDLVPTSLKSSTERLFQPRRISPESGERLRLGQQSYQRGLLLHGETKLVYQIPTGYQRFTAVAGLPATASKQAHAKLSITIDNQPPWEHLLSVQERGPFFIDLPVSSAKRLTIRLEDAQGLDISDQVLICKARFLK